jgi:hypothetical protein
MENKETLEEAAKRFYFTEDTKRDCNFIEGAKWQQEQDNKMYSLDDLKEVYAMGRTNATIKDFNDWLEQFKNK